MVRKPDVQYIRFVTDGSSARKLLPQVLRSRTTLPKARRRTVWVLHVDPLALVGIVLSAVMLVLLAVNCVQLASLQADADAMSAYVDRLESENARLQATYDRGYDLEDVRRKALALGMVPVEQVRRIQVEVTAPVEEEPQKDLWAVLTDLLP